MDLEKAKEMMSKMSEAERLELAKKLDEQLELEMANMEQSNSKYMDGWSEGNWEKEMLEHPFFATQESLMQGELSPLMQGLQDLKYSPEENSPSELGLNYKEDGNFNFKCKKYRLAIISYSEGLKHILRGDQEDKEIKDMKTTLIANRAASQFFLKNYRSSLLDCRLALAISPGHQKSLKRAVQCCMELKRYQEAIDWCDHGLVKVGNDLDKEKLAEFTRIQKMAVKLKAEEEKNNRKAKIMKKKAMEAEKTLLDLIKSMGIKIQCSDPDIEGDWDLDDLEPTHPAALNSKVHLSPDNDQILIWPVLFLYPEVGETDFVQEFADDQSFTDHLEVMFSERPSWDEDRKYTTDSINVYFEDKFTRPARPQMIEVFKSGTLRQALTDSRYRVQGGTPNFIITVKGSKFEKEFLNKYPKN